MDVLTRQAPRADLRLAYGQDANQFGDLWLPQRSGSPPALAVIHGGFWRSAYNLEHIGHLCQALCARGYAVWSLEYRRLGQDGGGWPGTFLDVAAGVDFLRSLAGPYGLDIGRLATVGHSAGGHLALWLAARSRIPAASVLAAANPLVPIGAVSLAGVVDLRMAWRLSLGNGVVEQLLGGAPDAVPERFAAASPAELLPAVQRQVLVHGTADEIVPAALSAAYEAAGAQHGEVRLVMLEGVEHFALIDPQSAAWTVVENAVSSLFD